MDIALIWFRRDLRLEDNPALRAALDAGCTPVPVYIHDEPHGQWPLGAASAWWLRHSLHALRNSLQERGSDLALVKGEALTALSTLAKRLGAQSVYWNRSYEPDHIRRDTEIKKALAEQGLDVQSFNGNLLREPRALVKSDGSPYRVFTAFWKNLQKTGAARTLTHCPKTLPAVPEIKGLSLEQLDLLPTIPWDKAFYTHWQPGEAGAYAAFDLLCTEALRDYPEHRDRPALAGTSRLSPHLHFGEISPQQVWQGVQAWATVNPEPGVVQAAEAYSRQLAWREFSHHLLYHYPHTADRPLDPRFEQFPWRVDYAEDLRRWQRGQTGIPLVDAGMRQLWTTGWMHNRVRMVVASLLTKNLFVPWQEGARWFWDTLVDADLANNTMGWQWTAGCGADAAPYFRIFNPVRQGGRFDPDGHYVRRWVPELEKLPAKWIHNPWQAPASVLEAAGVILGNTYPGPIVDLSESRAIALQIWDQVKQQGGKVLGADGDRSI